MVRLTSLALSLGVCRFPWGRPIPSPSSGRVALGARLYASSPVLCLQWSFTHHGAPVTAQGETRTGCQSVVCGALFEGSRGKDQFVDFEEAVAFDDAARDRVTAAGSACEWPTKLQRGDSCWRMASDSSQRELV
jgi:hypothetical protein